MEKNAKKASAIQQWKKDHPEKVKQQQQRYYLRHREQRLSYMKKRNQSIREILQKYEELVQGNNGKLNNE